MCGMPRASPGWPRKTLQNTHDSLENYRYSCKAVGQPKASPCVNRVCALRTLPQRRSFAAWNSPRSQVLKLALPKARQQGGSFKVARGRAHRFKSFSIHPACQAQKQRVHWPRASTGWIRCKRTKAHATGGVIPSRNPYDQGNAMAVGC